MRLTAIEVESGEAQEKAQVAGVIQVALEELHGDVHRAAQTRLHCEPLVCGAQRERSEGSRDLTYEYVNGKRFTR